MPGRKERIRLRKPTLDIRNNSLVRYSFKRILEREFDIFFHDEDIKNLELAKDCIEIYETEQEFFETTGWERDNPECASLKYLMEERVCRIINGEIWYFSGIRFADGLKNMMGPNCEENATVLRPG